VKPKPLYPFPMPLSRVPAALTTWAANRAEAVLYWLANRSAAVARGFTSYRIAYREELATSSLKAQKMEVLELE
jgi:hypothetical protein